ncbi:MAG TPA: peptidase, partial [Lachnospiraceae bacterium]|nr:peptidase [Lachnospiraceae bacterium]
MELWGSAVDVFSIDILSPSGEYVPTITGGLEGSRVISFLYEKTVLNIDYQLNEIHSGNPVYLIRFQDPAPGIWRIRVYARSDMKVDFHIWLPMGDFISDNTYFIRPDPFTTV